MINDLIASMPAKKCLIIANSNYSGTLSQNALPQITIDINNKAIYNWLKSSKDSQSRIVLSHADIANHESFMNALVTVLDNNENIIEGKKLHQDISAMLKNKSHPSYAPLQFAGHQSGDFIFIANH